MSPGIGSRAYPKLLNGRTRHEERAARKAAMENARRRAQLYATAAGAQLGPVLRISENVAEGAPIFPKAGRVAMQSVPVEAGTEMLEVEVHVTYALK